MIKEEIKEEDIKDSKGKWYVIQVVSGHENKIKDNITNKLNYTEKNIPIYELFIPVEKISDIKKEKKVTLSRKVFSGYIFARMDLYEEGGEIREDIWNFMKNLNGVIGFIGRDSSKKPVPLSDSEMAYINNSLQKQNDSVIPKMSFEVGEIIRIKEGAFENFEGAIQEIDYDKGKLKVLVAIFGRSTPVELNFWQVEK